MGPADLQSLLHSGSLLADGGMGTTLADRGVPMDACFDALNLDDPELVAGIHRDFVEAGARLVVTNTFGANRFNLAKYGHDRRVREVNLAGAAIARTHRAAEAGAVVAGSIGPLRVRLAPYGRVRPQEAYEAYAEQAAALAEGGVDLLLIETQSDLVEMEQALRAVRAACGLAVIVTATFTRDDRTLLGSAPELVAQRLAELGADGIGVNCSEGPAQVLRLVRAMRPYAVHLPLMAKPNAGGPARVGARIMYPATPEYLGEHARAFVDAGVSIVGGCCGTTPRHLTAMAEALRTPGALSVELPTHRERDAEREPASSQLERAAGSARPMAATDLAAKLDAGRFVVAVEMDPPRGFSTARLVAGAETLAEAGVDVVNVAGSSRARMRMSPWAPCRLIQERAGVETIMTFPTRGRNLLRIQGDLLAAHALGIRNLFICLGDPMAVGDYPTASDAVDVTPTGLIALVTGAFNKGTEQSGTSIGEPTSFTAGCALNLNASDVRREVRLTHRKAEAGAGFALSQPIYSADTLRAFRGAYERRYGPLSLPILVGVQPLVTGRHAEFLHNEVPGITIPEPVRARMHAAGDAAERQGLAMCLDLVEELRGEAAGVYLLSPFGRFDLVSEIVESVRRGGA